LLKFAPSELDLIGGVTSTHTLGKGLSWKIGNRWEQDRPLDRVGLTQGYGDLRTKLGLNLKPYWPSLSRALGQGDVSLSSTFGWFLYNPSYAARPDNSGLALFRYAGHLEISIWKDHLALGTDFTLFTDRESSQPLRPSELDWTPELVFRASNLEFHVAYERDIPLTQSKLVQHFVYLLLSASFEWYPAPDKSKSSSHVGQRISRER
jgi:hypothetical protein